MMLSLKKSGLVLLFLLLLVGGGLVWHVEKANLPSVNEPAVEAGLPAAEGEQAPALKVGEALPEKNQQALHFGRLPHSGQPAPLDEALASGASGAASDLSLALPQALPLAQGAGQQPEVVADVPAPLPENTASQQAALAQEDAPAPGEEVVKGTVEKGDTVSKILESTGSEGVYQYVSAARQVFSMRAFREGQPYVIITDSASGRVKRFEYEIDNRRRLVVEGLEAPVARVEPIDYVTLLTAVEATIADNLFQAVADVGESPQMALQLAELFGAEVNFIRDLQEGDGFFVLVEKRYREGSYRGYGRILAAHFTNKGKTFEAYLFPDEKGASQYFNRKGENLRKTLLQAPLAFTRLTSRFTNSRKHPILGESRPHLGVDYGAPTGTPVKAVGEGSVVRRGWAGGYGNQIVVRHAAGLESMYSHLSGYARGLHQGQRVRQGQVIGFVGSTGLSTGPHLDFRLTQNGKFINPTKAINPRGAPVAPRQMAAFAKTVEEELAYLKGHKALANYTVGSVVPERPVLTEPKAEDVPEKKAAPRKRRRS